MALVIGKKETRTIKITADEPGDLLKSTKHQFEVEFKLIKKDEVENIKQSYRNYDNDGADMAVLETIVDVKGIKENGNDVQYSASTVGPALVECPWVWNAIVSAFYNVQAGVTQVDYYKFKAKN